MGRAGHRSWERENRDAAQQWRLECQKLEERLADAQRERDQLQAQYVELLEQVPLGAGRLFCVQQALRG